MSMQGKAEIRVGVNLAIGTEKRLQSQLNALSKRLVLNINKVKVQNKQFQKSIADGMKNVDKQNIKQMKVSDDWQQQSAIKRYKLREKEEDRIRKLNTQQTKNIESQAKIREKVLNEEIKIRTKLSRLQESNNKSSKPMNTGAFTRFRIFDDLSRTQEQTRLQQGIDNTRNRLSGDGIKRVMSAKDIAQINTQLDGMQRRVSKIGNSKQLQQFNTDMGKIKHTLGQAGDAAKKTEYNLGNMMKNAIKGMVVWMASATLLFGSLRAFQRGLATLKEIDTELVNIAKVTGMSAEEMKKLAMRASEVGVTMGRTTQEYLTAVTEFSRGGYGEQAEDLARLSLLLQNVGNVSSEVANGMLLAVDAAYSLGGNTTELTKVINSLNEISNKNPTNIAKMSDGIKAAASVFSMAGVELNDFISLIGTATSTTQLGGSQIARGLRSVLLNITGVTDAGADVTKESISKAEEVLGKYKIMVRDSVEGFRNPMSVLGDIANEFTTTLKDNEVAQMEIIGRLAGKYQANILASILDNWDMVKKQQLEAMYSMNSAMIENEIYLNSWGAKSAQLSSAVSAFWQKSINTNLIKGLIDGLRQIVEFMTEWGGLIPILAGVITSLLIPAFAGMMTKLAAINISMGGLPVIIGLVVTGLSAYAIKMNDSTSAANKFNTAIATTIQRETDLLKTESDRITQVETMADRLKVLAEKEELSSDEKMEQKIMIDKLNQIYPTLKINVDKLTDGYETEISALKRLTEADRENLKQKILRAQEEAKLQLGLARAGGVDAVDKFESGRSTAENLNKAIAFMDLPSSRKALENQTLKKFIEDNKNILFSGTGLTDENLNKELVKSFGVDALKGLIGKGKDKADVFKSILTKAQTTAETQKLDNWQRSLDIRDAEAKIKFTSEQLGDLEKFQTLTDSERQALINAQNEEKDRLAKLKADRERMWAKFYEDNIDDNSDSKDKTKDPSYNDPTDAIIRQITAQSELNKESEETLQKDMQRAERAEDYTKAIELQGELLSKQKSNIDELVSSQGKLKLEADRVRTNANNVGLGVLDTELWFDSKGDTTQDYDKLYNSLDAKTQEVIKAIKDRLQSLKKAWREQQGAVEDYKDSILDIPNALKELQKKQSDLAEKQAEEQEKLYKEKVDAVNETELKIQEIIKYAVDKRKKLLDDEVDDLKKSTDERIAIREAEWDAADEEKRKKKEVKKVEDLQKKINALSRDTSLDGIAKRKELEKELSEELEDIEENREKARRELIKKTLQDNVVLKEESIEKEKEKLDEQFNHEKVTLQASEILRKQSFDSLKKEFPELFDELKVSSDNFFGVFESYEEKVVGSTTTMKTELNELVATIKTATQEMGNLFAEQSKIDKLKKEQDHDKVMIGAAQSEFMQLSASGERMGTNSTMQSLNKYAQGLRDKHGWEHEDLRGYKGSLGSFSQGINAGLVTDTGGYQLHGSKANPEWVLTTSQMYNVIKNLANNTVGNIAPKPLLSGGDGMNLSIVVNGNPDSSAVSGIKQAGTDILKQIKDTLKKKGN